MKVVILCGGKGTRLQAETEYRPKPMIPVGNRPILWHIMKTYAHYGHKDFILCLGYKGDIIREYFRNYFWHTSDITMSFGGKPRIHYHNQRYCEDWTVTLADTGLESMTAYRIRKIKKYLGNDKHFLLTYGDGVGDINIPASIDQHLRTDSVCTMTAVHPPGRFGDLCLSSSFNVDGFNEKPQSVGGYINGGFMVCSRKIFDYLPDDPRMMLEQAPMRQITAEGKLCAFRHEGFWQPMDTPTEQILLNEIWKSGKVPWKIWENQPEPVPFAF